MPQEDFVPLSHPEFGRQFSLAFLWECSFYSSLLCECLLKQCAPYTPTLLKLTLLMSFHTQVEEIEVQVHDLLKKRKNQMRVR